MALSDLTEKAVLQAIAEFDALHREPFLKKYGFGKSRGYFLVHDGKRYDSKAIAGAAHGYVGAQPLPASAFSGGDKTVARRLRELNFTIVEPSSLKPEGIPFELGKLYHRQRDIHQVFGRSRAGRYCHP